jgi:hypothetical protein
MPRGLNQFPESRALWVRLQRTEAQIRSFQQKRRAVKKGTPQLPQGAIVPQEYCEEYEDLFRPPHTLVKLRNCVARTKRATERIRDDERSVDEDQMREIDEFDVEIPYYLNGEKAESDAGGLDSAQQFFATSAPKDEVSIGALRRAKEATGRGGMREGPTLDLSKVRQRMKTQDETRVDRPIRSAEMAQDKVGQLLALDRLVKAPPSYGTKERPYFHPSQAKSKEVPEEAREVEAPAELRPPLSSVMFASIPKSTDTYSPMFMHCDVQTTYVVDGVIGGRGVPRPSSTASYSLDTCSNNRRQPRSMLIYWISIQG